MARIQHVLRNGLIALFLLWRALDFIIACYAPNFVSYLGRFSHPTTLDSYNIPRWIKGFAQFDGIFYLRIAQNGYSQFEQAFFPLYPLLIRSLSPVIMNSYLITSLLISNISFFIGLVVFRKYLETVLPKNLRKDIKYIILCLLLFPTSFFFGASYTESLFFLLVISTFYFLTQKNYLLVALFAFLASLTRFVGVLLFIPITISLVDSSKLKVISYKKLLILFSPFLGLGTYVYYLWRTTGDPLAFFNAQNAFGAGRSTHLILLPQVLYRYVKILITAQWNIGYFIALLELSIFTLVLTVLAFQLKEILGSKNKSLLGLNLFSIANLLIPTFTGNLNSIPRYVLVSLSFFIYLGIIKSIGVRVLLCFIFLLLHVALVTLFIQGYFVS